MKTRQATIEKYKVFLSELAMFRGTEITYDDIHSMTKSNGVTFVLEQAVQKMGILVKTGEKKFLISSDLVADEKTLKRLVTMTQQLNANYAANRAAKIQLFPSNGNGHADAAMISEMHAILKKIAERLAIKI